MANRTKISPKYRGSARALGFELAAVINAYLHTTTRAERSQAMIRALSSVPGTNPETAEALQLIRDWNGDVESTVSHG